MTNSSSSSFEIDVIEGRRRAIYSLACSDLVCRIDQAAHRLEESADPNTREDAKAIHHAIHDLCARLINAEIALASKDTQVVTEGTLRVIPAGEPVFLLRGQDLVAADTVRWWVEQAENIGAAPDIIAAASAQADRMEAWPKKKVPDLSVPSTGAGNVSSDPAVIDTSPAASVPGGAR